MQTPKIILLRAVARLARSFILHVPFFKPRALVWQRIVRPYLAWRPLQFWAESRYGAWLNLSLDDLIQRYVFFFGWWEPEISQYIFHNLRPGDIFIDVGANIGYHSLLASRRVGDTGKVYAVEASAPVYSKLVENVERNSANNITLINCAVCDKSERLPLYLYDADNCGATTILPKAQGKASAIPKEWVDGNRLQDVVPKHDVLIARIIKIDVEGAEWLVLLGLRDLLCNFSGSTELLVEANATSLAANGASIAGLVELLGASGFQAFVIPNRYDHRSYLEGRLKPITPWSGAEAEQVDFLFRRSSQAANDKHKSLGDQPTRVSSPLAES